MPESRTSLKTCNSCGYAPAIAVAILVLLLLLLILLLHKERIAQFELPTLDGSNLSFPGNKPYWVNFWSATCLPCMKELPLLDTLSREYDGLVQIVAIAAPYDPPPRRMYEKGCKLHKIAGGSFPYYRKPIQIIHPIT